MTPYDTSRFLTRRVPIYDSSSVVEYHSPVNSTKLLISRSVKFRKRMAFSVLGSLRTVWLHSTLAINNLGLKFVW